MEISKRTLKVSICIVLLTALTISVFSYHLGIFLSMQKAQNFYAWMPGKR